jgi:acetylglutamate kinase
VALRETVVLKVGGELVESAAPLAEVTRAAARAAGKGVRLAIVHGGGKEIDAALKAAGLEKRQIDGLRITDAATLDVVVAVLAGSVNTRFVAALTARGVPAVGLTGADAGCGLSDVAPPHKTVGGQQVDLGLVGSPSEAANPELLRELLSRHFVPVMASIGIDRDGRLLNVNADTMAGHVAARLSARRLVIAGSTPGVLDEHGATIAVLDSTAIARMVSSGTATAGMIAKLRACERALESGVSDVLIVDGRAGQAIELAADGGVPEGATRIVAMEATRA